MSQEHYFSLQPSEAVIAGMAATIFAAYVRNQEVTGANEDAFIKKAADLAVRLAAYTDKIVKSDAEWMPEENKAPLVL